MSPQMSSIKFNINYNETFDIKSDRISEILGYDTVPGVSNNIRSAILVHIVIPRIDSFLPIYLLRRSLKEVLYGKFNIKIALNVMFFMT